MAFLPFRQLLSLRSLMNASNSKASCTKRAFSSAADSQGRSYSLVYAGGSILALGGLTLLAEELEIRKATRNLEKGSKFSPAALVPGGKLLDRAHLQNRLVDLLHPYVCSMSHVDIVFGHEGTGRSVEVRRAITDVTGGVLYIDLQETGSIGNRILQALTGEQSRSITQRLRDSLRGGLDAHAKKLLEAAAERYISRHDRYPVVAFDHVPPKECDLRSQGSTIQQLGRVHEAESPSIRAVVVLEDAGLELLKQEADSGSTFRIVSMGDAEPEEAQALLQQHHLPSELARKVVELVGGRLSHLQEAVSYWAASPRWLSPMRPGASRDDEAATIAAHFAEIKKILYWDLDKRLRMFGGVALWPAATGDAPVSHQSPTDEDALRILQLLNAIHQGPLPAATVRKTIGEARFLQLLRAQVLGFVPEEGPLHKRTEEQVTFGSPAMRQYFMDRLTDPETKSPGKSSSGWVPWRSRS